MTSLRGAKRRGNLRKMKIYNTLTSKKEEFEPRETGKVSIYVCGPTVYNYIHIGNARAYVAFDTIIRYLKHKGFDVNYVRNLTDVDDKIIKRAVEEKTTPEEITAKYTKAFHDDMQALNVEPPTIEPKATEHIKEMIDTIQQLINKNLAYEIDGDVYFSVENFAGYGKLSKRTLEDMIAGARVEVDERKKNPADFALWKGAKEGEPSWPSPWGMGRPGWHIECSTMSIKYLGMGFDMHGGGQDLIFPHHENEIAQAEGATGEKPFVRYWLHNGFLNVEAEKMAKSVGNVVLIKDLEEQYKNKDLKNILRMLFLMTHYHSPLNFSQNKLDEAEAATNRIKDTLNNLQFLQARHCEPQRGVAISSLSTGSGQAWQSHKKDFEEAMEDDFNTPVALSAIFNLVKEVNTYLENEQLPKTEEIKNAYETIKELTQILGFSFETETKETKFDALLKQREEARKNKDFIKADEIRDQLLAAGYIIEDTPYGPKLKRKA